MPRIARKLRETEQRAANKRANDAAETTHSQHPADASGPGDGRIATWREGVKTGLRAAHAEARRKD
jgi:hypothetical protein